MAEKELCSRITNSNKITINDILAVENLCMENISNGDLYKLRNDAKIRAVTTSSSYDEFKAIVDAAHLKPLSKDDKQNSKTLNCRWNSLAKN